MSCQPSLPTTNSTLRPRATGFRNESGSGVFVICGLPYMYSSGGAMTQIRVVLKSTDGAEHAGVSCTASNRFSTGEYLAFNAKQVDLTASSAQTLSWTSADIGFGGFDLAITCALPGGTMITSIGLHYDDQIGT